MNLTPDQLKAAHSEVAETVCEAAAGSGKTRVLVERCRWLMFECGVAPEDLCVVTFTQAAAKELQSRLTSLDETKSRVWVQAMVQPPEAYQTPHGVAVDPGTIRSIETLDRMPPLGHCGTVHSLCLKLLRKNGPTVGLPDGLSVMTEEESDELLKATAERFKVKASLRALKEAVSYQVNVNGFDVTTKVGTVAQEFVRHMRQSGELSYDALLHFGCLLLERHPLAARYRHLLVDEFQDSAPVDLRLYSALCVATRFFVGDPRQSIYGFRGSDVSVMRGLLDDPEVAKTPISVNFRSSPEVVAAANRLYPGQVAHEGAPAGLVTLRRYDSPPAEAAAIACAVAALHPSDTAAVLCRHNVTVEKVKASLQAFGIHCDQCRDPKRSPEDALALDLLKAMCAPRNERLLLKLCAGASGLPYAADVKKQADKALTSVSSYLGVEDCSGLALEKPEDLTDVVADFCSFLPSTKFKSATYKLLPLAASLPMPCSLQDLLLAAQSDKEPEQPRGRVHVGTVHSAKGLEFDAVFLPAFEDETWPGQKRGVELDEEKRLAYVAVTRAKRELHMSWCPTRPNDFAVWKQETRTLSRFAQEVVA